MLSRNKMKQLGLALILFMVMGALAACGGESENATPTVVTVVEDEELTTEIPNEPTLTPMVEETPMEEMTEEPTELPAEAATEEMEPTVEAEETPEVTATAEMTETEETMDPADQPSIVRASSLLGMDLVNGADEEIAEIQEILFDEAGSIQYIILSVEEMTDEFPFYAVGWDTFAVSLSEEQVDPEVLLYEDDLVDLETALGFDDAMIESDDLFYETAEDAAVDTQMLDGLYKLSAFAGFDLFDYDLVNADSEDDLGEIEDLLVDLNENQIRYAVADVGGFLGIAETAVAIPWERVTFNPDEEYFDIDATVEALTDAPSIDMSDFEDWEIDTEWEQELETYWNDLTSG